MMPASPHTTNLDSDMPRRGALVALDVPPVAVGLHRVADRGEEFQVLEVRETEMVVRKGWEPETRTYRLGPGHVRLADH